MSILLKALVLLHSLCLIVEGRSAPASFHDFLEEENEDDYKDSGEDGLLEDFEEGGQLIGRRVSSTTTSGGACVLDVNEDLPKKNEPLLLKRGKSGSLEFAYPELEGRRGVIALREGEELVISCPGRRNYLQKTKNDIAKTSCAEGNRLTLDDKKYNSDEFECNSRVAASSKPTEQKCAGGKGIIVQLGFNVGEWLPLIDSCHNVDESVTYYSNHTIHGAILGGKVRRTTGRPKFDRGDAILFKGFNPEIAYTQRNQQRILSRDLGKETAEGLLDTKKSLFMARGHLAPDADFLFSSHQFLTYFYVNVAPQWQSINAGNWLKVEENTRRFARRLAADLDVVTGTYGVLKLKGTDGEKEIRLQESRLPAPELFWKVVRNTQDDSCIAFVSTNNPFLESKPKPICTDICKMANWPTFQDDLSKGYVYCCTYQELKKVVAEMPDVTCNSVLKGK